MINWEFWKEEYEKATPTWQLWPDRESCPICSGKGFIRHPHSMEDLRLGQLDPCRCRVKLHFLREEEQKLEIVDSIMAHSQMSSHERGLKVNGLKPWSTKKEWDTMRLAQQWACKFVESMEQTGEAGWGLFIGTQGCGKTHLMCGIANRLAELHIPTIMVYATALLNAIKKTFNENTDDFMQTMINTKVLMLDDLGTEYLTEWAKAELEYIFNTRWAEREKLPTIISTNLTPQLLRLRYPRIASRIMDRDLSTVNIITLGDYRQRRTL